MTEQPNVLFVVLDTVRADRVSALGYDRETTPTLDSFAADATLYTDAVAQAPWSIPSHASLFTGQYPRTHGTTTASPVLRTDGLLPELLSEAGYNTYAYSPNEYVRPATGFARGFDEFQTDARFTEPSLLATLLGPPVNWATGTAAVRRPLERAFNAVRTSDSLLTELPSPPADSAIETISAMLRDATEPFFFFTNLIDAHLPRAPAPEYVEQFVDADKRDVPVVENERAHLIGDVELGEREFETLSQLYDADLRTLDDKIERLLATFHDAGVLEDSMVVFVSDHGEHLGEFNMVGHQFSVFDSVVSVPLIVQYPDGGLDEVDKQVEIRRLFHTILDQTGTRSYPDQSLASGTGDPVARGSFHSPMIDIDQLLWEDSVAYNRDLLGEPLSFARTDSEKLVCFGDEAWLFELPEENGQFFSRERGREIYTQLADMVASGEQDDTS